MVHSAGRNHRRVIAQLFTMLYAQSPGTGTPAGPKPRDSWVTGGRLLDPQQSPTHDPSDSSSSLASGNTWYETDGHNPWRPRPFALA